MSLVLLSPPCTQQELDTYAFLSLVPPDKILHVETLSNFGSAGGEFCADKFVVPQPEEGVITANDICAMLLIGKDGNTVELAQCPPLGITCENGDICVEMTCWDAKAPCCNKPVAFENLSACDKIPLLKAQLMKMATCTVTASVNSGDGVSVSFKGASVEFVEKMLRECEAECYKCDPCKKPQRCFSVRGIGCAW